MIDPSFHKKKRSSKWRYPLGSFLFHISIVAILVMTELYFRREGEIQELRQMLQVRPLTEAEFQKIFPGTMVVETQLDPKSFQSKVREKVKYQAEQTQRVKEQSQARLRDYRERQNPTGPDLGPTKENSRKASRKNEKIKGDKGGLSKDDPFGERVAKSAKSQLQSANSQQQILDPSIKISTITLLNTDEYIYASFHNRMRDSISDRWSELLRRNDDFFSDKLKVGIYKTVTQILIARNGEIKSVRVTTSSGLPLLDKICVQAIEEVSILHNPPIDLFKAGEETMALDFTFMLVVQPSKTFQYNMIPDERLLRRR